MKANTYKPFLLVELLLLCGMRFAMAVSLSGSHVARAKERPTVSPILLVHGRGTTDVYSGDPTITGTNFSTVSTNDIHFTNTTNSALT